ncbi:MAG: VOC family protein [Nitrososphaerales archaeon]|nr:VOC family protein [Nitrososphaerales archaeon]
MISKRFSAAVVVSDSKRSARWFREKLGFQSSVNGHWVTVWPQGSTARLHLCEGKLEPGNTGVGFYSKNVERDAKRMKAKRVKFTKDVKDEGWGPYGMFSDPDGNVYWLIEGSGP